MGDNAGMRSKLTYECAEDPACAHPPRAKPFFRFLLLSLSCAEICQPLLPLETGPEDGTGALHSAAVLLTRLFLDPQGGGRELRESMPC